MILVRGIEVGVIGGSVLGWLEGWLERKGGEGTRMVYI